MLIDGRDGWSLFSNEPATLLRRLNATTVGAAFATPKRVLSDTSWFGGWRDLAPGVANHQMGDCCGLSPEALARFCREVLSNAQLPEDSTLQLTAATMERASVAQHHLSGVCLTASITAGVRHNAVWAGDPPGYQEPDYRRFTSMNGEGAACAIKDNGESKRVSEPGTINTTIFLDAELDAHALVHLFTIVAEVKADLLRENGVRSRYSSHLATGTGTDGLTLVCDPRSRRRFSNSSTHSALGASVAQVVRAALAVALRRDLLEEGDSGGKP